VHYFLKNPSFKNCFFFELHVFRIAFFSNFKFTEVPTYCDKVLGQFLTLPPSWPQTRPDLLYSENPWPETIWAKTCTSGVDLCDSLFFSCISNIRGGQDSGEEYVNYVNMPEYGQKSTKQRWTKHDFHGRTCRNFTQTARSKIAACDGTQNTAEVLIYVAQFSGLCSGADGRDTTLSQVNTTFTGTV
jgi:hypothetical protein